MLMLTISRWQERHNFLIKGYGLSFSPLRAVRICTPMKWSMTVINTNETPKLAHVPSQQGLWATDHPMPLPAPMQWNGTVRKNWWIKRGNSVTHFSCLETWKVHRSTGHGAQRRIWGVYTEAGHQDRQLLNPHNSHLIPTAVWRS